MKKLVILGGGESGVGAAILGKKKHWDVFLSDKGKVATKYAEVLIPFDGRKISIPKVKSSRQIVS